jgi:hypothetical protein
MTSATSPTSPPADTIPVYLESMGGSLIDSARISVMAALALLPPPAAPLIVLPGSAEQEADDDAASVHGCLGQAMEWLDVARAHAIRSLEAKGAPPTSFHVVQDAGQQREPGGR